LRFCGQNKKRKEEDRTKKGCRGRNVMAPATGDAFMIIFNNHNKSYGSHYAVLHIFCLSTYWAHTVTWYFLTPLRGHVTGCGQWTVRRSDVFDFWNT
jgi:hypothetical protein